MRYFIVRDKKVFREVEEDEMTVEKAKGERILEYDFSIHLYSRPEFLIEQNGELHDSSGGENIRDA